MIRRRFTLIELMFVCAMVLGIITSLTTLAYLSARQARSHLQTVRQHQRIGQLRTALRELISDSNPASWQMTETDMATDRGEIQIEMSCIRIGDKQIDPVSPDARVKLQIAPAQRRVVMVITWPEDHSVEREVRLVAVSSEDLP